MNESANDRSVALCAERSEPAAAVLGDAYTLISELWCGPTGMDAERAAIRATSGRVVESLYALDPDAAAALARFLAAPSVAEEEYIDLFELEPRCPLYLGSHVYDEPKTCAGAGVSDRNEYMIELVGIYRHFGHLPNGSELPDYLPLVVECLALTAGATDDPVRLKLMREYILPFLPPIRSRLQEIATPYTYLFDALERLVGFEIGTQPTPKRNEESDAG